MRRIRLLKLLEENNLKSPDILTAIVTAKSQMDAWRIASIFEEVTGDDLPVNLDEWERSVKAPVELYFVFKRKRDLGRFVRKMSLEFPEKTVNT
jgi:hypothetical protein